MTSPAPERRPSIGAKAVIAILLATTGAAMLAPLLIYPFGRDQGAFACVADVIARGGLPYRDAWEIKPPGIYYLFYASFVLFGRSMLAPRLLDFLWSMAAAGLLVVVGKRLLSFGAAIAGALCFLVFYALGFDYWTTTQCDGFASLPLTAAAALLVAAEDRRSWRLAAGCGAVVGLAMAMKLTLGAFLLLPCLAALFASQDSRRSRLARIAAYLTGCLAVAAAVAALIWRAGGWHDMVYVLFTWNAKYAALQSRVPLGIRIPTETLRFLLLGEHWILRLIGLLALVGAARLAFPGHAQGRPRWLIPTWALLMVSGVWIQAKFHPYHWLPVLPPLGLLAGHGLAAGWRRIRGAESRLTSRLLAASAGGLLLVLLASAYWAHFGVSIRHVVGRASESEFLAQYDDEHGDFSLAADLRAAQYIRQHTDPGTPIYIWGFEPLVYFLADRPPASRFITLQPLVSRWSPREWREELVRDLRGTRPAYLLVLHRDVFPWVTDSTLDSAGQLMLYQELRELRDADYIPAGTIEDFEVWQRKQ